MQDKPKTYESIQSPREILIDDLRMDGTAVLDNEKVPNSTLPTEFNSASQEFDYELKLIAEYKDKQTNAKSTLSREYYGKKLKNQIKRVLGVLAVLESGNPTKELRKDKK